jgi:hypothetical protein
MKFDLDVIPVAAGVYGPFASDDPEEAKDRSKDRSYRYVDLAAADGSGQQRATVAQSADGVDVAFPYEFFKPVRVTLELHGAARKVRCWGLATAALSAVKAA